MDRKTVTKIADKEAKKEVKKHEKYMRFWGLIKQRCPYHQVSWLSVKYAPCLL